MSRWLQDYSFDLPRERVAQRPPRTRDGSRLLVLERSVPVVKHSRFRQLPRFLRPGDLLVLNDSAVYPARLAGRKTSGGKIELLLLERMGRERWRCLMKGKAAAGMQLAFGVEGVSARVAKVGEGGEVTVVFRPDGGSERLMRRVGKVPLPPYIKREGNKERSLAAMDRERYQTIYAVDAGSVAAPTAGLHFTQAVFSALEARGVGWCTLTLHVGAGTFRPLPDNDLSRAGLESEKVFVPAATARAFNRTRAEGGRVIAVGTTATRALESFAGEDGRLRGGRRRVDLLIRPGYRFRAVDGMITNFHLPRSSLIVLAAAFAGRERLLDVYRGAVARGYRFYSYGDAMLIL
jgi:S-adenosylmethionine:tRNA ribosyltransferase-isomerase